MRYLVQDSLVNYTQMVVDSCWQVIDIKDTFEWPESDLINSNLKYAILKEFNLNFKSKSFRKDLKEMQSF